MKTTITKTADAVKPLAPQLPDAPAGDHWLALAPVIGDTLERWERQDSELWDARSSLDLRDRDPGQEIREDRQIKAHRAVEVSALVCADPFVLKALADRERLLKAIRELEMNTSMAANLLWKTDKWDTIAAAIVKAREAITQAEQTEL